MSCEICVWKDITCEIVKGGKGIEKSPRDFVSCIPENILGGQGYCDIFRRQEGISNFLEGAKKEI